MQLTCLLCLCLSIPLSFHMHSKGYSSWACVCVESNLTYEAFVRPENAVTYSAGNEGQKICGIFSEDALLLRLSGVAVVFHTFRWPCKSGAHAYYNLTVMLAELQGNTQLTQQLSTTLSFAQNEAASPCWSEN